MGGGSHAPRRKGDGQAAGARPRPQMCGAVRDPLSTAGLPLPCDCPRFRLPASFALPPRSPSSPSAAPQLSSSGSASWAKYCALVFLLVYESISSYLCIKYALLSFDQSDAAFDDTVWPSATRLIDEAVKWSNWRS